MNGNGKVFALAPQELIQAMLSNDTPPATLPLANGSKHR